MSVLPKPLGRHRSQGHSRETDVRRQVAPPHGGTSKPQCQRSRHAGMGTFSGPFCFFPSSRHEFSRKARWERTRHHAAWSVSPCPSPPLAAWLRAVAARAALWACDLSPRRGPCIQKSPTLGLISCGHHPEILQNVERQLRVLVLSWVPQIRVAGIEDAPGRGSPLLREPQRCP